MKGKFFYKIDYNTDNGKKQHRNSKVGKNYHNLESSGPKAGKTLYFWACIPHFGTDTVEKQGSGCIILFPPECFFVLIDHIICRKIVCPPGLGSHIQRVNLVVLRPLFQPCLHRRK